MMESLLNVETSLGVGIEVLDLGCQPWGAILRRKSRGAYVSGEGNWGSLGLLGEGDDTSDGGVSLKNSYSLFGVSSVLVESDETVRTERRRIDPSTQTDGRR
jgi:hypothetical protein